MNYTWTIVRIRNTVICDYRIMAGRQSPDQEQLNKLMRIITACDTILNFLAEKEPQEYHEYLSRIKHANQLLDRAMEHSESWLDNDVYKP